MTRRRLWIFRLAVFLLFPGLLLGLLELSLRWVGYGYPVGIAVPCRLQGKDAYCTNARAGWLFFPKNIARAVDSFAFPAQKPERSYRIFILGGSAAKGTPESAYSFGRSLEVMLEHSYPELNFEVVSLAMVAINSHAVRRMAMDVSQLGADLFIVYLGNNEVIGPYGPGTVLGRFSSSLPLIRLSIAVQATRIGQLLKELLRRGGALEDSRQAWRGMELFSENHIRRDDPRLESVYHHYRENLKDIAEVAVENGASIIFSTVGSNLKDSAPFGSAHREDLGPDEKSSWDELFQAGIEHEGNGDCQAAIEKYLAAATLDDTYAELQFRLARCYWALELYDSARERYKKALEWDTLRFRANERINEIVREVSQGRASEGIFLVDSAKVLEQHSVHGVTGRELFYEHVHLNFNGNYLLARTIFEQVERILRGGTGEQRSESTKVLSESDCAQRLAYTEWDEFNITLKLLQLVQRPPFTFQLEHEKEVERLKRELRQRQARLGPENLKRSARNYQRALQRRGSDIVLHWKYSRFLIEGLGAPRAAAEQLVTVLEHRPLHYEAYANLGALSGLAGDYETLRKLSRKALEILPNYATGHYNLGVASEAQDEPADAEAHYRKAIESNPDLTQAWDSLALLYFHQGKLADAEAIYREALSLQPAHAGLRINLGALLESQGRGGEALEQYRAAAEVQPDAEMLRKRIEKLEEALGPR